MLILHPDNYLCHGMVRGYSKHSSVTLMTRLDPGYQNKHFRGWPGHVSVFLALWKADSGRSKIQALPGTLRYLETLSQSKNLKKSWVGSSVQRLHHELLIFGGAPSCLLLIGKHTEMNVEEPFIETWMCVCMHVCVFVSMWTIAYFGINNRTLIIHPFCAILP